MAIQAHAQAAGTSGSGNWVALIVGLAIVVGLFLILREVVMWYWKINTIIQNQEKQHHTQKHTNDLLNEYINIYKKVNSLEDQKPDQNK
jgi:hypothetical protein